MTTRMRTKVRLVKCPKCAKILPEPEQVPLYTCGGCGTILQAKYYKGDSRVTGLTSLEQGQSVAQSNEVGHVPDGRESGSSSQRSSSAGEPSTDQNGVQDCKAEQIDDQISTNQSSSSVESSPCDYKENGILEDERDEFDWRDRVVNEDKEHVEDANSVDEACPRDGAAVLENRDSTQFTMENLAVTEDRIGQDEHGDGTEIENHYQKQIGDDSSARCTSTLNESPVIKDEELLQKTRDRTVLHQVENRVIEIEDDQPVQPCDDALDNPKQVVREVNAAREVSVLDESLAVEDKEYVQVDSDEEEVHDRSDCNTLGQTRKEHLDHTRPHQNFTEEKINCHDIRMMPVVVTLVEENGNGKDRNELVECITRKVDNINLSEAPPSTDSTRGKNGCSTAEIEADSRTFGSDDARAPSSATNLISTVGMVGSSKVSQEPQCESDSADKIKNIDNFAVYRPQMSEQVIVQHEVGSSLKVVPESFTKRTLAYDGSVSSFDGNDDPVLERQEHSAEENLSGYGAVPGHSGPYESPERSNKPSRRTYNPNQAKRSSQVLLDEKLKRSILEEEESVEENALPERNRMGKTRERFPPRVPLFRSSEVTYETGSASSYIHDEPPVLRTRHHPYGYEDSEPWLRKMYPQKGNMERRRYPEAVWRENEFLPMYYNYDTSGELYHRSRYHGYFDRRRRAESWSQSGALPPMPYSGEVFNGRYQIHDPYMHRHLDDLRWSAQLAQPVAPVCCHQGLREMSWDPYDSYPTSPPRFMESGFYPWAHDTVSLSDDQRHKDQVMRRQYNLREKRQTGKKFFLPIAGGAPFVTCYFCFNVLHLPEEFLLSRRRKTPHRLKCGACSRILEFSLENESCLAPYMPNSRVADTETNQSRNVNVNGREAVTQNSSGASSREKTEVKDRDSGNRERMEGSRLEKAGPSGSGRQMKVTWKLPAGSKSPLHRLMGYSSPMTC